VSNELLKSNEPKFIRLGNRDFEVPPLNLNILSEIEAEFGCSLTQLGDRFEKAQASTLRSLVWILVKLNKPEITKEQVGELIMLTDLETVSNQVEMILTAV